MFKKILTLLVVGVLVACSPTSEDGDSGGEGGDVIGNPCNPETYAGQYRCLPDENSVSGYAIAN